MTARDQIKLADLGMAKSMEKSYASSYVGTKQYMSPEISKAQYENVKYSPNTDVWYRRDILFVYKLKF